MRNSGIAIVLQTLLSRSRDHSGEIYIAMLSLYTHEALNNLISIKTCIKTFFTDQVQEAHVQFSSI